MRNLQTERETARQTDRDREADKESEWVLHLTSLDEWVGLFILRIECRCLDPRDINIYLILLL